MPNLSLGTSSFILAIRRLIIVSLKNKNKNEEPQGRSNEQVAYSALRFFFFSFEGNPWLIFCRRPIERKRIVRTQASSLPFDFPSVDGLVVGAVERAAEVISKDVCLIVVTKKTITCPDYFLIQYTCIWLETWRSSKTLGHWSTYKNRWPQRAPNVSLWWGHAILVSVYLTVTGINRS